MKYRQWKKNYKKLHGVNPPLELDKRKQRRLAKKAIKNINRIDLASVATRAAEALSATFKKCVFSKLLSAILKLPSFMKAGRVRTLGNG